MPRLTLYKRNFFQNEARYTQQTRELETANEILSKTTQPYRYMVEVARNLAL